jgi:hypothetical protein
VTGFAAGARGQVSAVAEKHVVWNAVDAHPGRLTIVGGKFGQLLDLGTVRLHGFVTAHAFADLGQTHEIARIGIGMAVLALETEGYVLAVAIRDGLHRDFLWGREPPLPQCGKGEQ